MSFQHEQYDVVVVGSGIVGLGAAYAAMRRGLRTLVLDRASEIQGASIRNFGHLCFGAQSGDAARYAGIARDLWGRLVHDAGLWVRDNGTLVAARHADELAVLEAARGDGGAPISMLTPDQVRELAPVASPWLVGGALISGDLQVDPRSAPQGIAQWLASRGVEFRMRTSATGFSSAASGRHGARAVEVGTSRGSVFTDHVFVAVNHDVDQLLPEVAEAAGIQRCSLEMLKVDAGLPSGLSAPLLTGWSLARYARFCDLPEASLMRKRLHESRPDLAAVDLNQMYTQGPDGSLTVGDSHTVSTAASPFRSEATQELLRQETADLFGVGLPRVLQRWQGVYAKGPEDFLRVQAAPGVMVLAATTGIGMTCGLGLAEEVVSAELGEVSAAECLADVNERNF